MKRTYPTLEAAELADEVRYGFNEEDAPSEPDYESMIQDRWEDSFDEDAMQDAVDNAIYDPPGL